MKLLRSFWVGMYALSLAACLTGTTRAQSDNPGAGLSAADTDVQIVYAVYGADDSYWNVTDTVAKLLRDSSEGFFAHKDVLGVKTDSTSMSLVILFNYDGHRHYFVRRSEGPKLSFGVLREAAKIDDAKEKPVTEVANANGNLNIVLALFGRHEIFWDVTDLVTKLLRDSPDGFIAQVGTLGDDPEYGVSKSFILIFDYNGRLHFYAQKDGGPKIDEATLWAAAKMDDATTKSTP